MCCPKETNLRGESRLLTASQLNEGGKYYTHVQHELRPCFNVRSCLSLEKMKYVWLSSAKGNRRINVHTIHAFTGI